MKQIRYMVLDTETDLLVDDCTSQDDAIERAGDLNRSVATLEVIEDGVYEYSDLDPRYKPVKVIIKELE